MLPIIVVDLTIVFAVIVGILLIFFFVLAFSLPSKKNTSFKGKHVLITGGSRGIGKQIAIESIRKGASVSIIARNAIDLINTCDDLNSLSKELKNGTKACWYAADMTSDYETIKGIIKIIEEKLGSIDILINNVGASVQKAFEQLPIEEFDKQIKLNYLSCVYATRAVIKNMKERRKGHIVFVSSIAGQCGIWGHTPHAASKFAVRGFAESLNMELLPFNISITNVYLPNTSTEGYMGESQEMSEVLRTITSTFGIFEPSYVAKEFVKGIEDGEFIVNIGLSGWLLGHLTSGGSPENGIIPAATQIVFNGIFRGIFILFLGHFNRVIRRIQRKKEKN